MTEHEKKAREVIRKWKWDCGDVLILTFAQSELLQQRIAEALQATSAISSDESKGGVR